MMKKQITNEEKLKEINRIVFSLLKKHSKNHKRLIEELVRDIDKVGNKFGENGSEKMVILNMTLTELILRTMRIITVQDEFNKNILSNYISNFLNSPESDSANKDLISGKLDINKKDKFNKQEISYIG